MTRKHFKIRAKERTTGQIVTPEYVGNKTREQVIEFFGLEEPDIERYEIEEISATNKEDSFNALANAYRAMYLSAKNDKERKDKINAFRAGNINP